MAQSIHRRGTTQELAATSSRNFRTFLLLSQFEAKEIGLRIVQARKERGMTQEDLAAIASFSKRSLQDYEAGVTIPYPHLPELGRLLKRPSEWFLYGEETTTLGPELLERLEAAIGRLADEAHRLGDLADRLETQDDAAQS